MLKYKTYLKLLFIVLVSIFGVAFLYLYIFSRSYPLPLLNRISLDAKIKFIKNNIDIDKVDTIIVGSSIGLNNIQGAVLEKSSEKCESVLNLSGFELRPYQISQILELTPVFPNLKRIIYSAQFSDFSASAVLEDYDSNLIKRYLTDTLSYYDHIFIWFHSYQNIISCIQRNWNWEDKHMSNNKFSYLGFDHTGSVPLHIYDHDIIKSRWEKPHPKKQDLHNYVILDKIVTNARKENINFYFVMGPYRGPLIQNFQHLPPTMTSFAHKVREIMQTNGGHFMNLHEKLHLNDNFFADRSHLNNYGSVLTAEAIGKYIDEIE